ncbi:MAG: antibiotic biosynthesis monooxygenase [Actinobacteria bacterium]|nr:antibiotic biosynthesis monooxygenase [Actinomycetota bacterium]
MLIVHVNIHVKQDVIEAFKEITFKNAKNSINEPGILQFDLLQQEDDPLRFVIVEVYKDVEATAKHKETAHYAEWRDAVESMMAEPRKSVKYSKILPAASL